MAIMLPPKAGPHPQRYGPSSFGCRENQRDPLGDVGYARITVENAASAVASYFPAQNSKSW